MGSWTLLEGGISYDWGTSDSYFYLLDKDGVKTKRIYASSARGSVGGFKIENLTRAIFTKARDVIEEFPSALVYNAFSAFMDKKLRPSKSDVCKFVEEDSGSSIIEKFKSKTLEPYVKYMQRFSEVMTVLSKCDDERSKRLINLVLEECSNTIKFLK